MPRRFASTTVLALLLAGCGGAPAEPAGPLPVEPTPLALEDAAGTPPPGPAPIPPTRVRIEAERLEAAPGDVLRFAAATDDADAEWDLGDGTTLRGREIEHAYARAGIYDVRVLARDAGASTKDGVRVVVALRAPEVVAAASRREVGPGDPVHLNATAFDLDGRIVAWRWELGDGAVADGPRTVHAYAAPGLYEARATATDDDGAVGVATVHVRVRVVPPVAGFELEPAVSQVGEPVRFRALADDADGVVVRFRWDFGDGTTSDERDPLHRYVAPGIYAVRLEVTDDDGASAIAVSTAARRQGPPFALVRAEQAVLATFEHSPRAPGPGDTVEFEAIAYAPGRILSYEWDLGDGTAATGRAVSHAYASEGSYRIRLRVTDSAGNAALVDSETSARDGLHPVTVASRPPSVVFSSSPPDPAPGDLVRFRAVGSDPDGRIVAWFWDFGDGTTSVMPEPTHRYATRGVFPIRLVVTDDDGAVATVSSEDSPTDDLAPVTVRPRPPRVLSVVHDVMWDLSVRFAADAVDEDGSVVSFRWDFGDGQTAEGRNVTHRFANVGPHFVTLTVTDDDGASLTVDSRDGVLMGPVRAELLPPVGAWFAPRSALRHEPVAFRTDAKDPDGIIVQRIWSFGDGNFSTEREPVHVYARAGTYNVTLTLVDDDGLEVKLRRAGGDRGTIVVPEPEVLIRVQDVRGWFGRHHVLEGRVLHLHGPVQAYTWDLGDGVPVQGKSMVRSFPPGGNYTVSLSATTSWNATLTNTTSFEVR